jgi:hypothetical protein
MKSHYLALVLLNLVARASWGELGQGELVQSRELEQCSAYSYIYYVCFRSCLVSPKGISLD